MDLTKMSGDLQPPMGASIMVAPFCAKGALDIDPRILGLPAAMEHVLTANNQMIRKLFRYISVFTNTGDNPESVRYFRHIEMRRRLAAVRVCQSAYYRT